MVAMTEADWIEKLGAKTPVERVRARRFIRSFQLEVRLRSTQSLEPFVLATPDGRTLVRAPGRGLHLDVGDDPQHWSEKHAAEAAKHWNRRSASKDHVAPWPWREFYSLRIGQLRAPL